MLVQKCDAKGEHYFGYTLSNRQISNCDFELEKSADISTKIELPDHLRPLIENVSSDLTEIEETETVKFGFRISKCSHVSKWAIKTNPFGRTLH